MRWDNLFDDLEGQLETELAAEEVDLRAEEERLRLGRMTLRDRLMALCEMSNEPAIANARGIQVQLSNATIVSIRPQTFGRDWISGDLVVETRRSAQFVLPLAAVAGLVLARSQVPRSIGDPKRPESGRGLSRRLGIGFVLRDLCRRRTPVTLETGSGVVHGTIDRVGRDHFDLAVHEVGVSRREREVAEYRVIPFEQLVLVRL